VPGVSQFPPYDKPAPIKNYADPPGVIPDISEAMGKESKKGVHQEEIDEEKKGRSPYHGQEFFPVQTHISARCHSVDNLPFN
jgi:hypothetical protein